MYKPEPAGSSPPRSPTAPTPRSPGRWLEPEMEPLPPVAITPLPLPPASIQSSHRRGRRRYVWNRDRNRQRLAAQRRRYGNANHDAYSPTNGSATFSATVTGTSNSAVTWSVIGGSTHARSLRPASIRLRPPRAVTPSRPPRPPTEPVTDKSPSRSTGRGTISPTTKTLPQGATWQFSALVTIGGSSSAIPTTVTWSVEGRRGTAAPSTPPASTPLQPTPLIQPT